MDPKNADAALRELDAMVKKDGFKGRGIKVNARYFFTPKSSSLIPKYLLKKLNEHGMLSASP